MRTARAAVLLFALTLAACDRPPAVSSTAADGVQAAQAVASEAAVPAVIEIREAVEFVAPPPENAPCSVDPAAVALIIRYEITSPGYYSARLEAPVWPGGQSGVTWGVGYDGGHQTRTRILDDWRVHDQVERLAMTAGVIGTPARGLARSMVDVRTPYPMAAEVFEASTLPSYCDLTARTFRNGWEDLPSRARGALVATVYNRGAAMQGDRRREMRAIRDECVPAADVQCIAHQLRSMPRLWAGKPIEAGLRARYEATAALALGAI